MADRERIASLAAVQALIFANLPVCSSERATTEMARRFADAGGFVFDDARCLLLAVSQDDDPVSIEALQVENAIVLLEAAARERTS